MQQQQLTGAAFEEEVRRVARLIWPTPSYQGARNEDERERDAFIETDDAIHIIEATTLRTKAKAEGDIEKTSKLVSRLRKERPDKVVKGWFITRDDLTADQMGVAEKYKRTVAAVPYKDFLSRLVDARSYLTTREQAAFGSIADPTTDNRNLPRDSFVESAFYDETEGASIKFSEFYKKVLASGAKSVLLGDFGAGKSMSLREVFYRASAEFYRGESPRFPVYLNLRSHIGQASPVEALIREDTSVGYRRYDDLVKAWRADLLVLILDGFDELLAPAWTQKANHLREHRAACSILISEFMRESPKSTPIIISVV